MPTGLEHVDAALQLIQQSAAILQGEGSLDTGARTAALDKLATIAALLEGTKGRFFLKSRLCLPFAARCDEEARKLLALLTEWKAQPPPDAGERLAAAVDALQKAVKTLDERSLMQGMAIT